MTESWTPPAEGARLVAWTDHASAALSFAFFPHDRRVVSAGNCGEVRVWDGDSGELLAVLDDAYPTDLVRCAVTADGRTLVAADRDGTSVHLWDVATWRHGVGAWPGDAVEAFAVEIRWNGDTQHAVLGDGRHVPVPGPSIDASDVALSPDLTRLVWRESGSSELRLTQLADDGPRWSSAAYAVGAPCAAVSPDGALLATACGANVRIWDVRTGAQLAQFDAHESGVASLEFSPDGELLATAGGDVRLWSVAQMRCIRVLGTDSDLQRHCSFSPDGRFLLACGVYSGDPVLEWDVTRRAPPRTVTAPGHRLCRPCYGPTGREVVSWSYYEEIVVADRRDGTPLFHLRDSATRPPATRRASASTTSATTRRRRSPPTRRACSPRVRARCSTCDGACARGRRHADVTRLPRPPSDSGPARAPHRRSRRST